MYYICVRVGLLEIKERRRRISRWKSKGFGGVGIGRGRGRGRGRELAAEERGVSCVLLIHDILDIFLF